jgi:glycosyltransferase involved in cell wall biosynthesis
MIARADGFIAAGSRGAIWFEKHGAPAGRIGIAPIPPSFPPPGFTPGPNVSDRHYDLLWCGRTTTSKGFDVFVKIATELVKGDPPRRIAIIGSPDIAKTTKDAISAGLKDQADIFGLVPPEQLPAFLTNSKIALFPSRNDAYGVGVIDAITCGALALASPMTGCAPDVLKPSETLPIDVPQRWVLACKQLLNDAKRYQNTRQQQASAIADNNPLHHGKAIWDAACDAVKCRSEIQQWG